MTPALSGLAGAQLLGGALPAMLLLDLNLSDWLFILLANAIIFGILGKKLLADIRGWLLAWGIDQGRLPEVLRSVPGEAVANGPLSAAAAGVASAQPSEEKGQQHEE